ncbi:MAG: FHA domain-containing protein [Streptosporangiaceae bacterium]
MSGHAAHGHGGGGHATGLFPVPGDGVLARHGDLILLCSLEDSQAADDLLDLLDQIAAVGGDGRQFADAIANLLEAVDRGPSVLAFGPSGSGLAITVSGGAWADVTTAEGTARIEVGHPRMLLRGTVRTAVTGVRGGLSPSDNGAASTDRFSRLDAGTVRAGGLSYYSDGTTRRSVRQPAGGAIPADQMTPSDISGAETSGMEIPRARGRAAGAAAAESAAAQEAAAAAQAETSGGAGAGKVETAADSGGQPPRADADGQAAESGGPAAAGLDTGASAGGADVPAESFEPPAPGVPFESTEAWAAPSESSLQERQATELWTAPDQADPALGEPSQAGAAYPGGGPPGPPPAGTQGEAAVMEPDVTAPPEQYGPASGLDPAQGEPFEAVLLMDGGSGSGVDIPAREPLSKVKDMPPGTSSYVSAGPIIQGVYCKNGHFDDPEALFCAICGISMNQQTLVPRPGERPPLGVLLLDDGAVFQLDSDYVIGREPSLDGSVAEGKARPLRITDDTGIVSRVHARIHLDGWRVLVTDLGSANGTRVLLPGQPADQPLVPQIPIVLATGSQVDLGGRGFRYESHRGR